MKFNKFSYIWILAVLDIRSGITISDIAKIVNSTYPNIFKRVNELIKSEILKSEKVGRDRYLYIDAKYKPMSLGCRRIIEHYTDLESDIKKVVKDDISVRE